MIPTVPANDHDAVVDALGDQTADAFEVLVVDDADLGICEARNAGIEAAAADIVAFTDDDCRPPAEWVSAVAARFESNPDLVCLEGPVEGGLSYDGTRLYPTCNLSVRRDAALDVGGFRAEYEYWREDTEFGWRLEAVGETRYAEDVRMVHPPQPRSSIVDENERRLRAEYPGRYEEVVVPDTVTGRVNDWLWRRGFWDVVDRVRYGW